jgi:BMFP domain-containing protein YqiC
MPLHNESFETKIMREQQARIKDQQEQIAALTAEVTTLKDERANAIRKRMKETLEWIFEGEFEAGTLADLLARSREENAVLQARIKELEGALADMSCEYIKLMEVKPCN